MILIVDDLLEIRNLLTQILTQSHVGPVVAVESAEEALARLDSGRTDGAPSDISLILMDILLPGIDGIAALCRIKANPRLADIPVILISSREDEASLSGAFMAGALDYVVKPFSPLALVTRVRAAQRLRLEIARRRTAEAAGRVTAVPAAPTLVTPGGRPASALLTAMLARPPAAGGWLMLGAIDGWLNLHQAAGETEAGRLKQRTLDLLARQGGRVGDLLFDLADGGFALLMERASQAAAQALGQSYMTALMAADIPHPRPTGAPFLTVSLALAPRHLDPDRAVAALEQAKADGGNRVVLVTDLSQADML